MKRPRKSPVPAGERTPPGILGPLERADEALIEIANIVCEHGVRPEVATWAAIVAWPPLAQYPDLDKAVRDAIAVEAERLANETDALDAKGSRS